MAYLNARGAPRDRHPTDGNGSSDRMTQKGEEKWKGCPQGRAAAAGNPLIARGGGRDLLPAEGARRDQGQGNRHPVLGVPPEHPLLSLHVGYPALPLFVPVRLLLLQGGPGGKGL